MSKHTPGPWKLERDELHYGSLSRIVGGPCRQVIVEVGGFAGLEELQANARLIASAPELLEALKDVVDIAYVAMCLANRDGAEYDQDDWLREARQAIAKAEGNV